MVLILALALRFYRLGEYMTFLGDEGRDALMVKRMLVELDPPLIGPPTSVGNIYLGPFYYYMMSVPMAIWWLNPQAAAGMVALIGVAAVFLVFYLSRLWFGKWPALVSSFLYAISPITIVYSRSSWNPNPAPFFTLLALLTFYFAFIKKNFRWFILTGAILGVTVQMHYLALIILPIIGIIWLYSLILKLKQQAVVKNFWTGTIGAILAFILSFTPWIVFDLSHNYLNSQAIIEFFSNRQTTINLNPVNTLSRLGPVYSYNLVTRHLAFDNPLLGNIAAVIILVLSLKLVIDIKSYRWNLPWQNLALFVWLAIGTLGLGLYKQTVFDHYLGFLNPAPFIIFGSLVNLLSVFKRPVLKYLAGSLMVVLITALVVNNIDKSPLRYPPNNQLAKTQQVAKFIIDEAGGEPFNFALIAEHNYDDAYEFYLDVYGHKTKEVPKEITKQLFVVCEDPVCKPVGHHKYEIAAFGWSEVEKETNFDGIKVFKLIHYQGPK